MRLYLLLFLLFSSLCAHKPPEINAHDVSEMVRQMMQAHVFHKELSPLLVQRVLEEYLDLLDPTKTYLLSEEVADWLSPTESLLKSVEKEIAKGNFSVFEKKYAKMIHAINRRREIEQQLSETPLPEGVSVEEFQDLKWVASEPDLRERLLRIKALQMETATQLDGTSKEKALQRILKRRSSREEEIVGADAAEQKKRLLSYLLKAFASSMDAHTAYFTPSEAAQFLIQVQQRLFGIGAQLRDDLNGFTIVKVIEGSPADTKLKANDRIIAINNEPVIGFELTDAVELIRGPEGTAVALTVLRPTADSSEEKVIIEITRGEIVIKEARITSSVTPFGNGVIAHLSLHGFYQDPQHSSAGDLYDEIEKIRAEHTIHGMILDLRNNSGGMLPQAVAVASLFITKGIVVSIKDNQGHIEHLRDVVGRQLYEGPLIILTSKMSASASEIVAQTLQDYGRALVVGDEHTYGKGSFQTFTLESSQEGKINPKGEFKVTRGCYYTVSGKSPQLVGVLPDLLVPGLYSAMEIGEKHAKYPLSNDCVGENFEDDLSDIPPREREKVEWMYKYQLQPRLTTYTRFLPQLKKNSEMRLTHDPFYQHFLKELKNENMDTTKVELYLQGDPQLKESIAIMKDLVLLLN